VAGVTVAYLHRCVVAGSGFVTETLRQPRAGSVAEVLLRDKDLLEPIFMAGMVLAVADDHYLDLRSMFIPVTVPAGAPEPALRNFAPYTVVRAAFEADARACWLLDPEATPVARLGRAMTLRAQSLRDTLRLGLLKSEDREPADYYAERIGRVAAIAERHSLEVKRNPEQEIVWVGEAPPNLTEIVNALFPKTNQDTNGQPLGWHTYSSLSARAHGILWAVLREAKMAEVVSEHAVIGEVVIDVIELMRLLSISLRLHSEAVRRIAVLDGREDEWEKRRGETAEVRLLRLWQSESKT
jgi:hypothetical protein